MKIPETVLRDIAEQIDVLFKPVYKKYVYPHDKVEFQSFSNNVLGDVILELENLLSVTTETLSSVSRNRLQTKRRWLNSELKTEGLYHEEINVVARGVYDQFQSEPHKCEQLYGFATWDELKENRIRELNEWASNHKVSVSEFRYIAGRPIRAIRTAITNDIVYCVLSTILERCPHGMQSAILEMPHSLSSVPIDYTKRSRISENAVINYGHEQYFLDKYFIDDETFLENLMNVEILRTGVISNVLKTLNSTDIHVFLYVMSLRDENFFNTREIVVDIGDTVRHIFSSDGQKNYTTVKESLFRMQFLNSGAIDASLRGFSVKIFDNVTIYTSETGKESARITVNVDIVTEYVKNQTINMYKEIIDRFNLDSSKIAIFPLQRERIRCAANSEPGTPLVFKTNLNFFRGILYLSNRKKAHNIKVIETMLVELIENHIAVKSYERKGDNFVIEFSPITDQERRDLLNQNENYLIDSPFEQITLDV